VQADSSIEPGADLRAYIAVLRRRKWSIAVLTIAVGASALFVSFRETPIYASESRVLVTPIGSASSASALGVPNIETESRLIDSAAVADRVVRNLDLKGGPGVLLGNLAVGVEVGTEILDITYSDPDPVRAQRISQGFATAYLQFRRHQARAQIRSQAGPIQAQIRLVRGHLAKLNMELATPGLGASRRSTLSAQRDSLLARLGVLEQELESLVPPGQGQGGQIVQAAPLPTSPSSPNHVRNGILALVVGLALGVGVALLRERLDDGLRGQDDLEERLQAPVLAVVPRVRAWRKRETTRLVTLESPKDSATEAFRALRTNLLFAASRDGLKTLMVVSPSPGEGKTTVSSNLAVVLAQAGKNVILVSADLRKPRIHRFFDVSNEEGITQVLDGERRLSEVMKTTGVEHLTLVPSGPLPGSPGELLQSEPMKRLLLQLREAADFVIVDTAPVLVVADALGLVPLVDGVVFVADASQTHRGAVEEARDQLLQVNARIIGAALNNFDPRKTAAYGNRYGYSYRYAYKYVASTPVSGNGAGRTAERGRVSKPE
jgi:capsular exopolysaccharide synthesis family protein